MNLALALLVVGLRIPPGTTPPPLTQPSHAAPETPGPAPTIPDGAVATVDDPEQPPAPTGVEALRQAETERYEAIWQEVRVRYRQQDWAAVERLLHGVLDDPLPPELANDTRLTARRRGFFRILELMFRRELQGSRSSSRDPRTRIDHHLRRVAIGMRALAWGIGSSSTYARELHTAFLTSLEIREPWRVCPALLASPLESPQLEIDRIICGTERLPRRQLREMLRTTDAGGRYANDLWRRNLHVREPLRVAAITVGAIGVGAPAAAIFFDQRYLALCRQTSGDFHGCVGDESRLTEAARDASVTFAIMAPALLVTSAALYIQERRHRRYRHDTRRRQDSAWSPRPQGLSLGLRF